MFWAKEEEQSSLVQLLKSDDVTLEAVLLNEFVVQDSRYGRPELVVYITEKENMVALLNLSLNPTINPNLPTKQQYRLSFIASEILTIRGTDVFQEKILTTDETRKVLTDFLSDDTPMTHLVAGFFAKIMECLLSRKLTLFQTFELLRETAFFDKCLQNINLGAVECLLENLVRIPNDSNGTTTVKNWMINDNLFEKLVNQISESNCDDKNECLSEVYCEILRELRDKLYMVDNKEDELHDKAMEEPLIAKLADNLVVDENCSSEDLVKKSSMISSSAKVLVALINTNFVAGAPAHHLEEVERNLIEERHFTYGLMKPCVDNDNYEQSYQPDPERMVEGIVANRLPNIFGTILKSIQANGSVWQPLLRLVIEVCNTNHLPTHEKLADALQKLPFIKLIEAAKKHPRATVMHSLLVKVVALILHSKFPHSEETLSPAAEYLLTGSDLIKNIYDSACSFHPPTDLISSCGLRAFNQNLGDVLLRAKKSSIVPPKMATLFKNDERWAELEDIILNYNGKHRPLLQRDYNNDSSMMSSLRNDSHGFNDSEEWTDASAKFAELDASSSNNRNFGSLGSRFEANLHRFSELDGQFDVTPDEDEFKKLCSERANSSSCSGTRSASDSYTWPGEEEKKGNTSTKPTPSKDEIWADFSSFVSGVDTPATNTSNPTEFSWPGAPTAEQGENTDWPLNSSHDSKPTDPATVGLAASISDDNSSEA